MLARAHTRRPQSSWWQRAGLLLPALLALVFSGITSAHGLSVHPADASLLRKAPREVVTTVMRVRNRAPVARLLEPELSLPEGWRAITPQFPFRVAPGETAIALVSFLVSERSPAGDHRVRYRVRDRKARSVSAQTSLRVRVLQVWRLQVELVQAPTIAIAGEPYSARFSITNRGNAPVTALFHIDSSQKFSPSPAHGRIELQPGQSEIIEAEVSTEDKGRAVKDRILLTANAAGEEQEHSAKALVEVVPRVMGGDLPDIEIPTRFTTSFGGRLLDGERSSGMQIEWAGSGALDDSGDRTLEFLVRGPSMEEETILGLREEIRVDYHGRHMDWRIGDGSYRLSPLTEQGRWGRGAGLWLRGERAHLTIYHMREELTKLDLEQRFWDSVGSTDIWRLDQTLRTRTWWGNQTGVGLDFAAGKNWRLGLNLLHKRDNEGRHSIVGLRGHGLLGETLTWDLEAALSDGDLGSSGAFYAKLEHKGPALRYRLNAYGAGPEFKGYYRDQLYAEAAFDYQAEDSPWGFRGYYRAQRYNLDGRDDYDAPDDRDALLGIDYRWPGGAGVGLDLRRRTLRDRVDPSRLDAVKYSVRGRGNLRLDDLDLSFNGSVELGRRHNRHSGERYSTLAYRLAGFWRPSRRFSLSGFLSYDDDATSYARREKRMSAGLGLAARVWTRTDLELEIESDLVGDLKRSTLSARLVHERPNKHQILLDVRHYDGIAQDSNIMLSYSVPIGLPVGRRSTLASLSGRVIDVEKGQGLNKVLLRMGDQVALSDERGYFRFPELKVGDHELRVAGGSLPTGMIPTVVLPMPVTLDFDPHKVVEIGYVQGASIEGRVQLYELPPDRLPSAAFRGALLASATAPAEEPELVPTRGVGGVLVTLSGLGVTMKRLTNANGAFRFVGLQPGTWTVTIAEDRLPADGVVKNLLQSVELEPGAAGELEFRVEKRLRRMRMLAPIKVSRSLPGAMPGTRDWSADTTACRVAGA